MKFKEYQARWNWKDLAERPGPAAARATEPHHQEKFYTIIAKRNGKFFAEYRRPGGGKGQLPWHEHKDIHAAKDWIIRRCWQELQRPAVEPIKL